MAWNVKARRRQWMVSHDSFVSAVAFSADEKKGASASQDAYLKVWDAETGGVTSRIKLEHPSRAIAFSPWTIGWSLSG